MRRVLVLAAALALLSGPAAAVKPDEQLADPAQEARALRLGKELRCVVCQNQSIDDSDAPLAKDLRVLVRERLKAGDSDREVHDYVVARYGEFVLLRPVFGLHTLLLWLTPILVLALGAFGLYTALRRRPAQGKPLDAAEQAALERLLRERGRQDAV